MRRSFHCCFSLLLLCLPSYSVSAEPMVLGWLEVGHLLPWGAKIKVKMDTGARTSSLHAVNVERFVKDEQDWVRFTTPIETKDLQHEIIMERPVVDVVKIKQHRGPSRERLIVNMEICLNGMHLQVPVSLADRSNFNYELILGRTAMKGNVIVDPAKTFAADKPCKIQTQGGAF